MCKTLCINTIDNIVFVVYNRDINIKRKEYMKKLADEIEQINKQSKQISDIRQDINDLFDNLKV